MIKWIVVMKIQPSICLHDWGKPRKNPSQIGRIRGLNPGPPECESRALPRSHLARFCRVCTDIHEFFSCNNENKIINLFIQNSNLQYNNETNSLLSERYYEPFNLQFQWSLQCAY